MGGTNKEKRLVTQTWPEEVGLAEHLPASCISNSETGHYDLEEKNAWTAIWKFDTPARWSEGEEGIHRGEYKSAKALNEEGLVGKGPQVVGNDASKHAKYGLQAQVIKEDSKNLD